MIFITGGARSGKSNMATTLASKTGATVTLIATARAEDAEMEERIAMHRRNRPSSWSVAEEPIEVSAALRAAAVGEVVILDCVTVWIANLMVLETDTTVTDMVVEAVDVARDRAATTIVVSNEVGSGIVPMDPVGRRFRDLQGWANQRFAAAASSAYLMVAGQALRLEAPDVVR